MREPHPGRTGGFTVGNLLLVLALGALAAALAYPLFERRAFDARMDGIAASVDAVHRAAVQHRDRTGDWPPPSSSGDRAWLQGVATSTPLVGDGFAVSWTRVEDVELPEPPEGQDLDLILGSDDPEFELPVPPPIFQSRGLVMVDSREPRVLGALLERYGRATSFVRDTTWTLILPAQVRTP